MYFESDDAHTHVIDDEKYSQEFCEGFQAAMDQVYSSLDNIAKGSNRPDRPELRGKRFLIDPIISSAWHAIAKRCYPGSSIIEQNEKLEAEWSEQDAKGEQNG